MKPVWRKQMLRDELLVSTSMTDDAALAWGRLLMQYRLRDGHVPDDDDLIARLVHYQITRWKKVRDEVVQHFTVVDGCLRHAGEDADIAEAKRIHEARRDGGHKTAAKRWGKRPVTVGGKADE